jgi:regulator of sigma E protease
MAIESLFSGIITLVAFLLMLALLVVVHELGHFLTAIRLGIKVEEFGIGFPPRAKVLFERDGVKYTLNWLPIGGFVRFGGEGETVYGVGSLASAAPWKKILVLLAGPLMNLVLAMLIFIAMFWINDIPTIQDGAHIIEVYENTPAQQAGFEQGDIILALNDVPVKQDISVILQSVDAENVQPINALIDRGGQQLNLTVTPGQWTTPDGTEIPIGYGFSYDNNRTYTKANAWTATVAGVKQTFIVLQQFIEGISQAIGGLFGLNEPPPGGVTGIVGIARGTGEVIEQQGMTGFWLWTALISLNLFLVNLFPIPALDGSHILFSLIEIVRGGKKIPPEREALVHGLGFVALLALMLIITVSDVANWLSGNSVLGN